HRGSTTGTSHPLRTARESPDSSGRARGTTLRSHAFSATCPRARCRTRRPACRLSDPGEPLVTLVLPVAALPAFDRREALDELDSHHVLRVFVGQLPLDPPPDRRAVGDRQRCIVQLVSEERLRMKRILEVDALVIEVHPVLVHRIGAIEDDESRFRLRPYR